MRAHRRRRRAEQQAPIIDAWWAENLRRRKRVPPLRTLLAPARARVLTGPELAERRTEFSELAELADRL